MANVVSFEQLAGAVQAMEQSDIINRFFKDHVEGKRDARKQNKIRFIQQQSDVDPVRWANVDAAQLYIEQLRNYIED